MTLSKPIIASLTAIVLTGSAAGVLVQWNPFVLTVELEDVADGLVTGLESVAGDLEVVAGETFQGQITQIVIWLGNAEDRLADCRAKGGDCSDLNTRVANLKAELARLTALKAKYGG